VFIYEDNAPVNGQNDLNENGLGGFNIILMDPWVVRATSLVSSLMTRMECRSATGCWVDRAAPTS